jgi:molybdenum cofactor guanylyltransferase
LSTGYQNGDINKVDIPVFFPGIAGVILAGGQSLRMGRNKALIEIDGLPLIKRVHSTLSALFPELLIVTNSPENYQFLNCTCVPDQFVGEGSLAGIHSALFNARNDLVFVTACDMPFLSSAVIRQICALAGNHDIVVPESQTGLEPLQALYRKSCLPAVEQMLKAERRKILWLYEQLDTRIVQWQEICQLPGADRAFQNLNTPEDLPLS